MALTGCTAVVTGSAVPGLGTRRRAAESKTLNCEHVSPPLTSIDRQEPGEPKLPIPQPPGWQRFTMLDSKLVRYALANKDLISNSFASTAIVGWNLRLAPRLTSKRRLTKRDGIDHHARSYRLDHGSDNAVRLSH